MNNPRLVNLLGALSLALADAQNRAIQESSDLGSAACAALNTLAQYPAQTIRQLATVAGLSHSVMVRTVEALVQQGLATKSSGEDKREIRVRLTREGDAVRARLSQARTATLDRALATLSAERQSVLLETVSDLLLAMTETRQQADHICRLCDEAACGDKCPVEQRARETECVATRTGPPTD